MTPALSVTVLGGRPDSPEQAAVTSSMATGAPFRVRLLQRTALGPILDPLEIVPTVALLEVYK
jgi:hypothetical protein